MPDPGLEPPIQSEESPSSTPCEECGRPACWLCSADRGEVTLCDDCYAKVRHLWGTGHHVELLTARPSNG